LRESIVIRLPDPGERAPQTIWEFAARGETTLVGKTQERICVNKGK
jgi:hypothetical protein